MTVQFSALIVAVVFGLGAALLRSHGHRWALSVYCVLLGAGAVAVGAPIIGDVAGWLAKIPLNVQSLVG